MLYADWCVVARASQVLEQVGVRRIGHWCIKEWYLHSTSWGKVYEVYMLMLILVLPLSAMSFAYVSICCELWTVLSSGSHDNTRQRTSPGRSVDSLNK
jgi:hypothetical protein